MSLYLCCFCLWSRLIRNLKVQYLPQHGADFVYQIKKDCLTTQSFTVLHLMVQCSVLG